MGWEESLEEVRRRLAPTPGVRAVLWAEEEDWRGELLRKLEKLPPREAFLPEPLPQPGWRERVRTHKPALSALLLLLAVLLLFSPFPAWLRWPLSIFFLFLLVFFSLLL
jgi:hypothetical protein